MQRLFSYTVAVDDGAAPNPFNGMCTLAICKPSIRRVAKVNDWIAGLGSSRAPSGDLSGHLIYAMRVEEVLTLREYDVQAPKRWPHRIPNIESLSLQERLGDCIYDYSKSFPTLRPSVHGEGNIQTDIGGMNVLISSDFYYFGRQAVKLPSNLLNICHQTQGHKSNANKMHFTLFVSWLRSTFPTSGQIYGWPDHIIDWSDEKNCGGCSPRANEDKDQSS